MAYEPLASRSVTACPAGTGTNTLSVCGPLVMMGGKPVNVKGSPARLRTMEANDDPPLLGVSTKCQYAPNGQPLAGAAVSLCSGRLLAGGVAADAGCATVVAIQARL